MSMRPQSWPEPAEEVARAIHAIYVGRRAPLAVVVRDELDEAFVDEEFAQAFAVRGQPGWSPGRLAMITVLQAAEHFTDAQAAEAVRTRLDWKYCLVRREAPPRREGVEGLFRRPVAAGRRS